MNPATYSGSPGTPQANETARNAARRTMAPASARATSRALSGAPGGTPADRDDQGRAGRSAPARRRRMASRPTAGRIQAAVDFEAKAAPRARPDATRTIGRGRAAQRQRQEAA